MEKGIITLINHTAYMDSCPWEKHPEEMCYSNGCCINCGHSHSKVAQRKQEETLPEGFAITMVMSEYTGGWDECGYGTTFMVLAVPKEVLLAGKIRSYHLTNPVPSFYQEEELNPNGFKIWNHWKNIWEEFVEVELTINQPESEHCLVLPSEEELIPRTESFVIPEGFSRSVWDY